MRITVLVSIFYVLPHYYSRIRHRLIDGGILGPSEWNPGVSFPAAFPLSCAKAEAEVHRPCIRGDAFSGRKLYNR